MKKDLHLTLADEVYCGYMGIMEKKMEAAIVYWGYMGVMEMETTRVPFVQSTCTQQVLPAIAFRRCPKLRALHESNSIGFRVKG